MSSDLRAPSVFAIAALIVAALLAAKTLEDTPERPTERPAPRQPTAEQTLATHTRDLPAAGPSPNEQAAQRTARRFLRDYLPYSYGQPQGRLTGATPKLARQLRRSPPRVPAEVRRLRPVLDQLTLISSHTPDDGRTSYKIAAAVHDGRRAYTITLTITRPHEAGTWQVGAVT